MNDWKPAFEKLLDAENVGNARLAVVIAAFIETVASEAYDAGFREGQEAAERENQHEDDD